MGRRTGGKRWIQKEAHRLDDENTHDTEAISDVLDHRVVLLPPLLQRRLKRVVPLLEDQQRRREHELDQLRRHRSALLQWHHENVMQDLQDLHVTLFGLEKF